MTKRRYRFGKPALQRFMERNFVLVEMKQGNPFPVWKRNTGRKGTNMWAFAVPQLTKPEPVQEEPIVKVEVRDVEAPEPGTQSQEEDSESDQQDDTSAGGGLEEAARSEQE